MVRDSREAREKLTMAGFKGKGTAGIQAASASMKWAKQAPGRKQERNVQQPERARA